MQRSPALSSVTTQDRTQSSMYLRSTVTTGTSRRFFPVTAFHQRGGIHETSAIPAAGPIASDVRFKKRVLGSLAIHFALIPVFPQSEKARCLLEKDTKS